MSSRLAGARLARNSVFNILGQGIPLLAAIVAIPILIRGLGTDRFGVLTLAWMIIGYFGLFDLGLSRALTQVVSSRLTEGNDRHAPPLVWTALGLMLLLGLLGAALLGLLSPWLVGSVLKIPPELQPETLTTFYILSAAIPVVVLTAGLVGVLSAFQRFGILNLIRVPLGIFSFVAPLAVLPFSQSLALVALVLVAGRLLALLAHLAACWSVMPSFRAGMAGGLASVKPLLHFGAWMSVTNVVGPLMVYLDRFAIGVVISVTAVAYYATPYEMITKLLIVPAAILGVLFPAFAASYATHHAGMVRLFDRGTRYIGLMLFPVILLVAGLAHEGLQWWLGADFALQSTLVLQILAIGVFVNSIAQVFAALIQGVGRPDLSAKLHLIELPIYLLALWWAIHNHGIVGAAVTWTGRVILDAGLLLWMCGRFLGEDTSLRKRLAGRLVLAIAILMVPILIVSPIPRLATVFAILLILLPTAWFRVLMEEERNWIRLRVRGGQHG